MLKYYGLPVSTRPVEGSLAEFQILGNLSVIASAIMSTADDPRVVVDYVNKELYFLAIPIYLDVYGDRSRVVVDIVQGPITYPFTREQVYAVRALRERLVQ